MKLSRRILGKGCYLCGRPFEIAHTVYLADADQSAVMVGADCYLRVGGAGGAGLLDRGVRIFAVRIDAERCAAIGAACDCGRSLGPDHWHARGCPQYRPAAPAP